ncbi:MAG: heme o synthase [bacterium]|nr:heme o synthase [bacterium]
MGKQVSDNALILVAPTRVAAGNFIATLKDIVSLGKPGILGLLLISTGCPLILASAGAVDLQIALCALLGGALVTTSASALNCLIDADIDAIMNRTKNRPLPAGRLGVRTAIIYALITGVLGMCVLFWGTNSIAALTALFGHLFYVVVYSCWLKRTTAQNIVIGGAAGAVPPMVGIAAATGQIDLTAVMLFLVVFLWTPPHFWALALNKNEDYKRAGIPMLPVTAGRRSTHLQMLIYAILLWVVTNALVVVSAPLGAFSAVFFNLLGAVFVYRIVRVMRADSDEVHERLCWKTFGFSLIYLAVFFLVIVIDSAAI